MCTLTVIPEENGYALAMNRDERIARGPSIPPEPLRFEEGQAVYPRDIEGGTWVAANDRGVALALLNWNDACSPAVQPPKVKSRGLVIPLLIRCSLSGEVQAAFAQADFSGLLPFRLIGVFPSEHQIWEWRWDMRSRTSLAYSWTRRHWFSSSLSDERAATQRGTVCRDAWSEENAGSVSWLRKLHASHVHGPLALCVHRDGVQTLSYTEFLCSLTSAECRHFSGSPCAMKSLESPIRMRRTPSISAFVRVQSAN
jgi:hypothetical protein